MAAPIGEYVKQLLAIVAQMQMDYPKKKFTLDGRLVGDIGEILAEQQYDLELLKGLRERHDAISRGRFVQVKTTMKNTLGLGDIPDYYLGLKVDENGGVEEIFNGPGSIIWEAIKHRRRPKNHVYPIPLALLRTLNNQVEDKDRIRRR
jgi:hypothetical protein